MDEAGRQAYKRDLLSILKEASTITDDVRDNGRVERIRACIKNTVADIDACETQTT